VIIPIQISTNLLQATLATLEEATKVERALLWLGKASPQYFEVVEVHMPLQITRRAQFTITQEGMEQLYLRIRETRLQVVAQIHTHPAMAFHSAADDEWAICRHLNAYSIVVPYFCATTNIGNFKEEAATYILNADNEWMRVSNDYIIIK
jgi:hypothetical protein